MYIVVLAVRPRAWDSPEWLATTVGPGTKDQRTERRHASGSGHSVRKRGRLQWPLARTQKRWGNCYTVRLGRRYPKLKCRETQAQSIRDHIQSRVTGAFPSRISGHNHRWGDMLFESP